MTPDKETFNQLVQNAAMSADQVAIGFSGTDAEKTRAIVRRALECLIGNGLIEVRPADQWPDFISLDPPYSGGYR